MCALTVDHAFRIINLSLLTHAPVRWSPQSLESLASGVSRALTQGVYSARCRGDRGSTHAVSVLQYSRITPTSRSGSLAGRHRACTVHTYRRGKMWIEGRG